jgi:Ran-binding protein 1
VNFILFSPFTVTVELEEVKVLKDEDVATILYSHRSKLYHFIKEDNYGGEVRTNYWKERGLGDVKIMQDKKTSLCRIIMRQEKTLKPVANFMLTDEVELTPSAFSLSFFLSHIFQIVLILVNK